MSDSAPERPSPEQAEEAWHRFANELRAIRAQREREWAGIDEALLTRYFLERETAADTSLLDQADGNAKVKQALTMLDAMREAGKDWLTEDQTPDSEDSPPPTTLPFPRRPWVRIAAAACLLLAVGVAGILGVQNRQLASELAQARREHESELAAAKKNAVAATARQMYSPWFQERGTGLYLRFYLFRVSPDAPDYVHQYVVWDPRRRDRYLYYFNPTPLPGRFWCRFDLGQNGEPRCETLPQGKRPSSLKEAEDSRDYSRPEPMPPIPGASDGIAMLAPPRDLPPENGLMDLPRVGG